MRLDLHSTNSFSIGRVGSVGKSSESEFRKPWHASSAPVDAWVALFTRHSAGRKMPVIAWKMLFLSSLPALMAHVAVHGDG